MAGYNLTASDITDAYHSEDELWSAINPVFQTKSRNSTSYKYCFLKAILDNIFNVNADLVLPFAVILPPLRPNENGLNLMINMVNS